MRPMATPFPQLRSKSSNGDATSTQSSFLTAPRTPIDPHDVPFRPLADDRTSLNMKKRHHKHSKAASTSSSEPRHIFQAPKRSESDNHMLTGCKPKSPKALHRCRSLEETYHHSSGSISPTSIKIGLESQDGGFEHCAKERRWTLPSKSEATRGFTPLKSTVKQSTLQQDTESPAMITLRRATNNPTPRKSEITFFPEPTFSHEKNGLLSYLISTFGRTGTCNDITQDLTDNGRHSSRSTSIDNNSVQGTVAVPAATVCTETTVDASLAMPGVVPDNLARRRCSTKYTSGSIVYEIIWDENDSVSNGGSSSHPSRTSARRSSLAVLKLEAQLAKSEESSRRQSQVLDTTSRKASAKSVDMFPEHVLTISKLEAILPRLLHKTGLRNLPRSRGKRQRKSTNCSIMVEEADPRTLSGNDSEAHKPSVSSIEFFPPLRSRRSSGVGEMSWQGWRTSDAELGLAEISNSVSTPQSELVGSTVASGGQTKRRNSSYVTTGLGFFRQPFKRFSQSNADGHQQHEDRQPLLA